MGRSIRRALWPSSRGAAIVTALPMTSITGNRQRSLLRPQHRQPRRTNTSTLTLHFFAFSPLSPCGRGLGEGEDPQNLTKNKKQKGLYGPFAFSTEQVSVECQELFVPAARSLYIQFHSRQERGIQTVKTEPLPRVDWTAMVPSQASTSSFTIVSPRPMPSPDPR